MKKYFVRFSYNILNFSVSDHEGSFIFSGSDLTDRYDIELCERYVWEKISNLNDSGYTGLKPKICQILQLTVL